MHPILLLQGLDTSGREVPGIETNLGSSYSGAGCIAGPADSGEG
ncbi:hypothetical protein [Luteibacter aegosomatissinici]|nr:hypothetical protein [Luteibacter aegosomatissinici]